MSSTIGDGSYRINVSNGLLLYYHHYSYYSQKVLMALHEKNLPFEECVVDIIKGAQFEPWFLEINPRGEVPVLQDVGKIIPDSTRIIDYLEDNFSNGDTPRLIPIDQGAETRQKVMQFRQLLDQVPAGIVTMGSIFHPEFVKNPKAPFFGPVRKMLANAETNSSAILREYAEKNPKHKDILLQKADLQEKKHFQVISKDEFAKVIGKLDNVLDKIEEELAKHGKDKKNWWLCTDRFTVADVSLAILLERLNQLGFESRFWTGGRRPNIEKYYENVKLRESYTKTIPSTCFHVKMLICSQNPTHLGLGIAAAVAIIIGGVIIVKKILH
ncbi:Glutathione S-transferase [Oryctes borbonicus]|uniref:Glutathione S-transferase n=1 Tax=Oryctes borbonicus TaxID=1629725 RepID=A0A0T6AU78_9SCAR|nr:Glutathione S-transferase [Oryctes borbonicus]